MAVVPAQFALALVQVGRIGEGRRQGLFVRYRGVAAGFSLRRRDAVVLVLVLDRRASARAQGLAFCKLIPQLRHSFFLLHKKVIVFIFNLLNFSIFCSIEESKSHCMGPHEAE